MKKLFFFKLMKVFLNNQELIFENILLKDNNIYIESDFGITNILNYDEFIELLKISQDSYVDCSIKETIFETVEQYFTYFKITSNPLVKRNMVTKITYVLLNNLSLKEYTKIMELLSCYKSYKTDKYYTFLRIILNISQINKITDKKIAHFDDKYFTMLDFILDYY